MKTSVYQRLNKIYHDPRDPGSLGGLARLASRAKELGITKDIEEVKDYLETQRSYTYHKQARKNFSKNKTIVSGIDAQWQADLADMHAIADDNDDMKYLLTCIDVFTKYAWVVPVKDKSSNTMKSAFEQLLQKSATRVPLKLQTDKGLEFLNKQVQSLLKNFGIAHFTTMGETKAALVERFNRTLKTRIWRHFTASKTKRYLDVLEDIVHSYNNSIHRSTRMKPSSIKKSDEPIVWRRLYGNGEPPKKSKSMKANVADSVRITKWKGDFAKGYEPNWTEEEFRITEQTSKQLPHQVYKIEDLAGEPIAGSFYKEQLQKIQPTDEYIVEKIVNRRTDPKTKRKEILVKWEGWPEKFNCWIPETNLN